jgi:hypothetical protein
MTQVARTVAALKTRLDPVYTDRQELAHTAKTHADFYPNFLKGIEDVLTIMVHETDGATARPRTKNWCDDYRTHGHKGIGPQLVVWPDGIVYGLVELPYITMHGGLQSNGQLGSKPATVMMGGLDHIWDGPLSNERAVYELAADDTPGQSLGCR